LKNFNEAYSSGDCSGFSPDSLLIPISNKSRTKVL